MHAHTHISWKSERGTRHQQLEPKVIMLKVENIVNKNILIM